LLFSRFRALSAATAGGGSSDRIPLRVCAASPGAAGTVAGASGIRNHNAA
jgi:hypothetical protein